MDQQFEFSLEIELSLSSKDEIGCKVELLFNSVLVVGKVNFILVDSLLEQFTKNVINLKKNDKCGEIHGLINDTLIAILWCGENCDQDGRHSKDTDDKSQGGLNKYPSALLCIHHDTGHSHKEINGDLLDVPDANHENNVGEAESKDSVLNTAQNEDTLTFNQGFEDLTEGEARGDDTEPTHHLESISERLCLGKLSFGGIFHFGEVFSFIICLVENRA